MDAAPVAGAPQRQAPEIITLFSAGSPGCTPLDGAPTDTCGVPCSPDVARGEHGAGDVLDPGMPAPALLSSLSTPCLLLLVAVLQAGCGGAARGRSTVPHPEQVGRGHPLHALVPPDTRALLWLHPQSMRQAELYRTIDADMRAWQRVLEGYADEVGAGEAGAGDGDARKREAIQQYTDILEVSEWSLVAVGPEGESAATLPGVVFLGARLSVDQVKTLLRFDQTDSFERADVLGALLFTALLAGIDVEPWA